MTNASFTDLESIVITDTAQLIPSYGGTGLPFAQNRCGVESERTYAAPQGRLMTPRQSQAILKTLAAGTSAITAYEINGSETRDPQPGAIIKTVTTADATYSLELSATFETATPAYPVTQIKDMLRSLDTAERILADTAYRFDKLAPCEFAVYPYATLDEFAAEKVARQRLVSELESFRRQGNQAGLKTMLMGTSAQVSLSYADEATRDRQFIYGQYLAPLYYATFSNTNGVLENKRTDLETPRAQWWLDHNAAAARAGIPAFAYDDQCDVGTAWVDYVQDVPMVYYLDKGQPVFGREKSFADLQQEQPELGNMANFNLAQSLVWTDVRLCEAGADKRMEFRAADSGEWQPYGLTALTIGLLGTPSALDQTRALLQDCGLLKHPRTNRAIVETARNDVATRGLATDFGRMTLGRMLQEAMTIVETNPLMTYEGTDGLAVGMDALNYIALTGCNDTDYHKRIVKPKPYRR